MNATELFDRLGAELDTVEATPAFEARLVRSLIGRSQPSARFVLRRGPALSGAMAALIVSVAAGATATAVGQSSLSIDRVPDATGTGLPSPSAVLPSQAYVSSGAPPVEHDELMTLASAEQAVGFKPLLATLLSDRLTQVEVVSYTVPAPEAPWQVELAPHLRLTYATAEGTVTVDEIAYPHQPNGALNIPGETSGVIVRHAGGEYLVSESNGQVSQVTFASNALLVTVTLTTPIAESAVWRVVAGVS